MGAVIRWCYAALLQLRLRRFCAHGEELGVLSRMWNVERVPGETDRSLRARALSVPGCKTMPKPRLSLWHRLQTMLTRKGL